MAQPQASDPFRDNEKEHIEQLLEEGEKRLATTQEQLNSLLKARTAIKKHLRWARVEKIGIFIVIVLSGLEAGIFTVLGLRQITSGLGLFVALQCLISGLLIAGLVSALFGMLFRRSYQWCTITVSRSNGRIQCLDKQIAIAKVEASQWQNRLDYVKAYATDRENSR